MVNIAIFASGSGTNVENIVSYFRNTNLDISVSVVFTNNPIAGVIERCRRLNVDFEVIDIASAEFKNNLTSSLQKYGIQYIVLAGYLKLIPNWLIELFPEKIINIHPALLPKYGGKGMYGMNVHREVISNKEVESGITIHLVNSQYDEGKILAQYLFQCESNESPESLAKKIHELEMNYFPKTIENYILKLEKDK